MHIYYLKVTSYVSVLVSSHGRTQKHKINFLITHIKSMILTLSLLNWSLYKIITLKVSAPAEFDIKLKKKNNNIKTTIQSKAAYVI